MNQFFKINKKNRQGLSTLEMLIAMTIIILVISVVLPLVSGDQSASVSSQTNQEALYKALALLEEARANSKEDFNLVNPINATADNIYQKSLTVDQIGLFTKKVTSNLNGGVSNFILNVKLTTLLTNPNAVKSGDTCSSVLTGNWHNAKANFIDVSDGSGGNPVTDVDVNNGKLYFTINSSRGSNANDFYIYNISPDPKNPTLIKAINTGPGLEGVAVAGDYAYVANTSRNAQLQVIDIHNPNNPVIVANYKLTNVTGNGAQALGNAIFYANNKVYLGLTTTVAGPEFHVFDVSTPTAPVYLGNGYNVGHDINNIYVKNNYAYIVTPDSEELKVLDISNPSIGINRVGGFDAPGGSGNGKSIYKVGNMLYLGRTLGGHELYILNDTNPATNHRPTLGFIDLGNDSINGILVRDYLAFLVTNGKFIIYNISNPSNIPAPIKTIDMSQNEIKGTAVDCEGNYIYIASHRTNNNKGVITVVYPEP